MRKRLVLYTDIPDKRSNSFGSFIITAILLTTLFCFIRSLMNLTAGGRKKT